MFKSFLRSRPTVSIFHNPSSPQSTRALELLRASLSSNYPPEQKGAGPLEFDLEVVDSPPTPDQVQTILSYLPSSPSVSSAFLSSHPTSDAAGSGNLTTKTLAEVARQNPNALKWPIVVDWMGGRASIGDVDGVKGILEAIRKVRDGEARQED